MKIYISRNIEDRKEMYLQMKERIGQVDQYLFVPDQYTLLSDINLMNILEVDVLMDIKVKSFSSFSSQILTEKGGITRKVVSQPGMTMLLKKTLQDSSDQLDFYNPQAQSLGFLEQLARTIKNFKDLGKGPEDLEKASEKLPSPLKDKLRELALIYRTYDASLGDHYLDTSDRLSLLNEKLGESPGDFAGIPIYFDNYNDLNDLELEIIQSLHQAGAQLNFFLVLDPALVRGQLPGDEEVFQETLRLFYQLREIGQEDLEVIPLKASEGPFTSLIDNIFSYEPEFLSGPMENLFLLKSDSTTAEVDSILEIINRKIKYEGYSYSDFSIITAQPLEYDQLIRRAFSREDIPFFLDGKRKYSDNHLASYLISIVKLAKGQMTPLDYLNFLKFGYKDLDQSQLEDFEKFILKRKIQGDMIFDDKFFEIDRDYFDKQRPDQQERMLQTYESVNRVRAFLLNLLGDYFHAMKEERLVIDHVREIFKLLGQETINQAITDFIQSQTGDYEKNTENQQIWDIFNDTIDQLVEVVGEDRLTGQAFADILLEGIQELEIGVLPPSQDSVFVGSIMRTRSNPSKVLMVLGLNDKFIPGDIKAQSLLTDSEIIRLQEEDFNLPLDKDEIFIDQQLNLYISLLKAQEQLYLSSSLNTKANEAMAESIYYKAVRRVLPDHEEILTDSFIDRPSRSKSLVYNKMLTIFRQLEANIINIKDEDEGKVQGQLSLADYASLYPYLKETDPQSTLPIDKARAVNAKREISGQTAEKFYQDLARVSISRLETFNRCPYRHFVSYLLRPDEETTYEMDYWEIGNIAHQSLEDFIKDYKKEPEKFQDLDDGVFEELSQTYVENSLTGYLDRDRKSYSRNRVIIDKAQANILDSIKIITRQLNLSSFSPVYEEMTFGYQKDKPGLLLDMGDRRIYIEGFIDRVDSYVDQEGQTNTMVIDYKTGQKSFSIDLALGGIEIQLPIYLKAAVGEEDLPAAFFYMPIREVLVNALPGEDPEELERKILGQVLLDGAIIKSSEILQAVDRKVFEDPSVIAFRGRRRDPMEKENVLSPELMDQLLEDILGGSSQSMAKILRGDIEDKPFIYKGSSQCVHCDYKNICKFDMRRFKEYRPIKKLSWKEYGEIDGV